jgi:dolichyl-phosphate-mannose-protein mannosyltransferase
MPTQIAPPARLKAALPYLILLVVAAGVCAPLLWYGAPNGHSIEYNLVWLKNFAAQLAQGDFYPRWLMGMNHGAGSPVFYFYAPLPFYILSLPALLFPASKLIVQLAIGEWLLIALSGMAFYRYARASFAAPTAFAAAMLYMVLPYHFEINLWWRQDIGELTNYIWMPLALYYSDRILAGEPRIAGLALVYALMVLSHLPSTLLFSIGLGAYVLVVTWRRHSWRQLMPFAAAIAIGLLLAAIYWIPALFSEQYVRADKLWTPYFDFHYWFFPLDGLPTVVGHDNVFALRLFAMIGLTSAIFVLAWLNAYRWRHVVGRTALFSSLTLIAVAWFLMSPWSEVVWETLPELWKVQFPWRIAMVVDLATAIAVLHSVHCLQQYRDRISGLALALVMALLLYSFGSANVLHKLDPFDNSWWVIGRDQAVRNGLDAPEYTTAWNPSTADDTSSAIAGMPELAFDAANGSATVALWRPRSIDLNVDLKQPALLRLRQFYFPNWRVTTSAKQDLVMQPDTDSGLITLQAPAGRYTVSLRLMPLRQEIIGGIASVIGFIVWSGCWWWQRRTVRKTH